MKVDESNSQQPNITTELVTRSSRPILIIYENGESKGFINLHDVKEGEIWKMAIEEVMKRVRQSAVITTLSGKSNT